MLLQARLMDRMLVVSRFNDQCAGLSKPAALQNILKTLEIVLRPFIHCSACFQKTVHFVLHQWTDNNAEDSECTESTHRSQHRNWIIGEQDCHTLLPWLRGLFIILFVAIEVYI